MYDVRYNNDINAEILLAVPQLQYVKNEIPVEDFFLNIN